MKISPIKGMRRIMQATCIAANLALLGGTLRIASLFVRLATRISNTLPPNTLLSRRTSLALMNMMNSARDFVVSFDGETTPENYSTSTTETSTNAYLH